MKCQSFDENLLLDFQRVEYDSLTDTIQLGVLYDGDCELLLVELFQKNESAVVRTNITHNFTLPCDNISMPANDFTDETYFQVEVTISEHNRTTCSSSRNTFYQIVQQGL